MPILISPPLVMGITHTLPQEFYVLIEVCLTTILKECQALISYLSESKLMTRNCTIRPNKPRRFVPWIMLSSLLEVRLQCKYLIKLLIFFSHPVVKFVKYIMCTPLSEAYQPKTYPSFSMTTFVLPPSVMAS